MFDMSKWRFKKCLMLSLQSTPETAQKMSPKVQSGKLFVEPIVGAMVEEKQSETISRASSASRITMEKIDDEVAQSIVDDAALEGKLERMYLVDKVRNIKQQLDIDPLCSTHETLKEAAAQLGIELQGHRHHQADVVLAELASRSLSETVDSILYEKICMIKRQLEIDPLFGTCATLKEAAAQLGVELQGHIQQQADAVLEQLGL